MKCEYCSREFEFLELRPIPYTYSRDYVCYKCDIELNRVFTVTRFCHINWNSKYSAANPWVSFIYSILAKP